MRAPEIEAGCIEEVEQARFSIPHLTAFIIEWREITRVRARVCVC
jgi:hypothetical protein